MMGGARRTEWQEQETSSPESSGPPPIHLIDLLPLEMPETSMNDHYTRRELLKAASLTGAGILLTSCSRSTPPAGNPPAPSQPAGDHHGAAPPERPVTQTTPKQSAARHPKTPVNTPNVSFLAKEDDRYDTLRQGYNKRIEKRPRYIAL